MAINTSLSNATRTCFSWTAGTRSAEGAFRPAAACASLCRRWRGPTPSFSRGPKGTLLPRKRSRRSRIGIPGAPVFTARLKPAGLYDEKGASIKGAPLTGRRFVAVCAVAQPASFASTLASLDLLPEETLVFRDHHRYTTARHRAHPPQGGGERRVLDLDDRKGRGEALGASAASARDAASLRGDRRARVLSVPRLAHRGRAAGRRAGRKMSEPHRDSGLKNGESGLGTRDSGQPARRRRARRSLVRQRLERAAAARRSRDGRAPARGRLRGIRPRGVPALLPDLGLPPPHPPGEPDPRVPGEERRRDPWDRPCLRREPGRRVHGVSGVFRG